MRSNQIALLGAFDKIHIFQYSVAWLGKVWMRIEARVKKRDRGSAAPKLIRRVESHRGRNDFQLLFGKMRESGSQLVVKLRVSPNTIKTDWLARFPGVHVDRQQRVQ